MFRPYLTMDKRFWLGRLAFSVCLSIFVSPAYPQFKYPMDDLIITIDALFLWKMANQIRGQTYGMKHSTNGAICSNPAISFKIDAIDPIGRSEIDLINGSSRSSISLDLNISSEISQCIGHTVRVDVSCKGTRPVGYLADEGASESECQIRVPDIPLIEYRMKFDLPTLLFGPSESKIKLPNGRLVSGDLDVGLEFAYHNGQRWQSAAAPRNKEKDLIFSKYAAWNSPVMIPDTSDPNNVKTRGTVLGSGLSILQAGRSRELGELNNAFLATLRYTPVGRGSPLGTIFLRDSLIAPRTLNSTAAPRYGLIGSFFPLMIRGKFRDSTLPFDIELELVASGLTSTITSVGGVPRLNFELFVEQIELRSASAGASLPIGNIKTNVEVDGPYVDIYGKLKIKLKNVRLSLQTEVNGINVTIELGSLLEQGLNGVLVDIAKIEGKFQFEAPDCIAVETERVVAERPCPEFGNRKDKLISRRSPSAKMQYGIDFAKTRVEAVNGQIAIMLFE